LIAWLLSDEVWGLVYCTFGCGSGLVSVPALGLVQLWFRPYFCDYFRRGSALILVVVSDVVLDLFRYWFRMRFWSCFGCDFGCGFGLVLAEVMVGVVQSWSRP